MTMIGFGVSMGVEILVAGVEDVEVVDREDVDRLVVLLELELVEVRAGAG